jgi:DNA topoisomerase IB
MRHTHASFDYAIRGEFDEVAANLGNSATISRKHYIAPATRKEAVKFLQLTPAYIKELIAKGAKPASSPGDAK